MESMGEIVGTVAAYWAVALVLLGLAAGLADAFERKWPSKWTRNGAIGKR